MIISIEIISFFQNLDCKEDVELVIKWGHFWDAVVTTHHQRMFRETPPADACAHILANLRRPSLSKRMKKKDFSHLISPFSSIFTVPLGSAFGYLQKEGDFFRVTHPYGQTGDRASFDFLISQWQTNRRIEIYTDGSYAPEKIDSQGRVHPERAGWAFVILGVSVEPIIGFGRVTCDEEDPNYVGVKRLGVQGAEYEALYRAFNFIRTVITFTPSRIAVFPDSTDVIRLAKYGSRALQKSEIAPKLFESTRHLKSLWKVSIDHVFSHNGHCWNNLVDKYADIGSRSEENKILKVQNSFDIEEYVINFCAENADHLDLGDLLD